MPEAKPGATLVPARASLGVGNGSGSGEGERHDGE